MTQYQGYLPYALFVIGFVMIIKGSDWFIDTAVWIAKILKIPDIIIGATLVSICTTLPEAMVSVSSALRGNTDMALGNAMGSIACNTGLILAITIIFSKPRLQDREKFQKKGILLIVLLVFVFVNGLLFGGITRAAGIALLITLVWYLHNNIVESKLAKGEVYNKDTQASTRIILKNIIMFIFGVGFTIWGANLLVVNGEIIARNLGVPDMVIGLTMTAFGTSLPELMTSITAIIKKAHNISIGNILGANILNIILVTGLSSTIMPIPINLAWMQFHLPFVLFLVGATVAFSFINKHSFKRRNGFLLLGSYIVYIMITIGVFN